MQQLVTQVIDDRVLRFPALKAKLGNVSRSSVDRWEKYKNFPKRIKLGENSVGWRLSEVDKWLRERTQGEGIRYEKA